MKKITAFIAAGLLLTAMSLTAQDDTNGVRLFQSFNYDAPINGATFGEGFFTYNSYNGASSMIFGAQGGLPLNEQMQINVNLGFQRFSANGFSSSGLQDVHVYGRYKVMENDQLQFSAVAQISLPVGKEEIGGGKLNFGGFGAVRYDMGNGIIITGNAGLLFMETTTYKFNSTTFQLEESTEYSSALRLGGGGIYPLNEDTSIVGELVIITETNYTALSVGADKQLAAGRARAGIALGLDDGAPDLQVMVSFLKDLN